MAITTPDVANVGDPGHVSDHNLMRTALLALDITNTVVTLNSQSGTVTIDVSAGKTVVVNLVGNVTSWNIINSISGEDVEIHFVQDATGSRTLTGANAAIKLAGAALTLTTAATKRDVLVFRSISSKLFETSRVLNLAP